MSISAMLSRSYNPSTAEIEKRPHLIFRIGAGIGVYSGSDSARTKASSKRFLLGQFILHESDIFFDDLKNAVPTLREVEDAVEKSVLIVADAQMAEAKKMLATTSIKYPEPAPEEEASEEEEEDEEEEELSDDENEDAVFEEDESD